ncbi:MAG: TRAP transporter substrate-binding protein [Halodesulfovibrio sp.]|uniref:TRAP transporter substrate-binding protein n=1 Tax=Halodesulfovibrio sp. TaxID=1912772 RepID=UPI00359EC535
MKLLSSRIVVLILCVTLGVFAARPSMAAGSGKKIKIRLAHGLGPSDVASRTFEKFKELVAEETDGKIKIKIFGNAMLGTDRVVVEAVQGGAIEMAQISSANMSNFSSAFQAFDLPYITSPKYQANLYKAMDNGPLHDYLVKEIEAVELYPVMFPEFGYRNFVTTDRAVSDVASLGKIKMRTTSSPVEVAVAKALGMNPAPIAWGEVYTALQQGTVEGEGNTFSLMYSTKHNEVLKHAVTSQHNYSFFILVTNAAFWKGLDPADRAVLENCSAKAMEYCRSIATQVEEEAKDGFRKSGVVIHELTDAERTEYKEKTKPVWDQFTKTIPADLIKLIQDTQS